MIESMQDATSKHALQLLRVLCFYHHDQIPVKMFYNAWHNSKKDPTAPSSSIWPEAISNYLDFQRAVQASVTLLASFSLISRDSDASLSLHPLVHDWCQDRMSGVERQSGCRRAVSLLARSVEWKFETEDYRFRRSLVSHVHACLRAYDRKDKDFDDDTMREWSAMALILEESGSTRDALQMTEQVVEHYKSKLGEDHRDTVRSMHNLANQYSKAGRVAEALELTEQAVELYKSKLGEDHPDTLRSIGLLDYISEKASEGCRVIHPSTTASYKVAMRTKFKDLLRSWPPKCARGTPKWVEGDDRWATRER